MDISKMALQECIEGHRSLWQRVLEKVRAEGIEQFIESMCDGPELRVDRLKDSVACGQEHDLSCTCYPCHYAAMRRRVNQGACAGCPLKTDVCDTEDALMWELEKCTSHIKAIGLIKKIRDAEFKTLEELCE